MPNGRLFGLSVVDWSMLLVGLAAAGIVIFI
jgi:hypothetical protein